MAQTASTGAAQASLTALHKFQKGGGSHQIGSILDPLKWEDANVFYKLRATATTILDQIAIDLETGAVTETASPTVVWEEEDLEGFSLGTMATLYGIHVRQTVAGTVSVQGYLSASLNSVGDHLQVGLKTGTAISGATTDLTVLLATIGAQVEITAVGKTA